MMAFTSNKLRFYLLIAGAVLFFPVSWKLALKKTVEVRHQLIENTSKLSVIENNTPEQLARAEKRLAFLNKILEGDESAEEFQNRVLNEVSSLCHQKGLLLREIPAPQKTTDNAYQVETINIQMAGSFHHLLEVLYELEDPRKKLNLVAARFMVEENKRLKQKQLLLNIYIQVLQGKDSPDNHPEK